MKNTFAPHTFAAWTYNSGAWTGVGTVVIVISPIACLVVEDLNRIVTEDLPLVNLGTVDFPITNVLVEDEACLE